MHRTRSLAALALLVACGDKEGTTDTGNDGYILVTDDDLDGYPIKVDCDDSDPAINPGANERCDGVDNNCDGQIDESGTNAPFWYADFDGDGFGVTVYTTTACEMPAGYAAVDGDCDDFDAAVNPDAVEVCDDIDNDCDTVVDGAFAEGKTDYYRDGDGDGYGDSESILAGCEVPPGYVDNQDDCDDSDAATAPGADEQCDDKDNDCDGRLDETCEIDIDDADLSLASWVGEEILDYAGYDIDIAGDVNGDGVNDLVVGAPQFDPGALTNAGRVYVVHGPATAGEFELADADATISGTERSSYLGYELRAGTDFDGDGYSDVVTSAYYADAVPSTDGNEGKLFLYYGPVTGDLDTDDADLSVTGASDTDLLGQYFLGGIGDLDGSGKPELAVGAHYVDIENPADASDPFTQAGALYIFADPGAGAVDLADALVTVVGTSKSEYIGYSAASADIDGDGVLDLFVGASGESEVYVYTDSQRGTVTVDDADVVIDGNSGDGAGSQVVTGEFTGDGAVDVAIGAKYNDDGGDNAGKVFVIEGPFASGATIDLEDDAVFDTYETQTSKFLGTQIASMTAGDVDGDGVDDLLLGSYQNAARSYQSGAALLYYGPLDGSRSVADADRPIVGTGSSQSVGIGLSIGDLDGDGQNDVAVGARGWSYSRGAVFLFPGTGL